MNFSLIGLSLVAGGAACGGMTRYLLLVFTGGFHAGLLLANGLGGAIAGAAMAHVQWEQGPKLLLFVGFLGALTTLSGVTVEVLQFLQQQAYGKALGILLLHNIITLATTCVAYLIALYFKN